MYACVKKLNLRCKYDKTGIELFETTTFWKISKTTKHWWKKLMKSWINGEIGIHELEDSISISVSPKL